MSNQYHSCPRCGMFTDDIEAAKVHFGFRKVGDKKYIQSFCRSCKLQNNQESRELRVFEAKRKELTVY